MSTEDFELTEKQNEVYSHIIQGGNIFLTGPGGVGKSAIIKMFNRNYKDNYQQKINE